jgi:basic membrane lipoprotein Med (substrate-binding protein (PBP1-ABC) superfamily)
MNKKLLVLVAILIVASLLLASCQKAEVPAAAEAAETTTEQAKLKVFGAFATPIEEPWDGVIHAALQAEADKGAIEYTYTENIGYSGDMERILREVAEQQKPDLIVGDAFGNEEAVRAVAADYPEIAFAFGSSYGPTGSNLAVFDNWIQEPAYLCGMLAGGMTKSNKIGVVAAMPIPEVDRLVNAFIAGAKEVNPDAQIYVTFINSFFDPATAKEAALAQIDAGVDILYAERSGVIEAAAENGLYVFGNMSDQNETAPEYVITGPVWDMTPTVEYLISQVTAGVFTSQDLKDFSMYAKGGASLADFHGNDSKVPADVLALVEAKEQAIKDGTFRVDIDESEPAAIN